MRNKILCLILCANILEISSCKKFLDVPAPVTSTNQENVYQNDYTSAAVLTGLYTQMMGAFFSGSITSISLTQELAADNLVLNNLNQQGYLNWWRNDLTADYSNTGGYNNYFVTIYPRIYTTNAAIEGLSASKTISSSVKQRLLGEAYFLRSFYYFYLTNLFGDVPLILSTDYTKTASTGKSPSQLVYQQIESDLRQSLSLLNDNYVDGGVINTTQERLRPNLSAALSLLARVELYKKDFSSAEQIATQVINKTSSYAIVGIDSVFKKNSKETIWALQPVKLGFNTDEGAIFLLNRIPGTIGPKFFSLSPSLTASFESNDKRLSNWIGSFSDGQKSYQYAAKYKVDASSSSISEYCIVLRLAELYLIRAESRMEQSNISGALEDLNVVRRRAGLPPITTSTIPNLRSIILHERRVEFFTEWGHRWFDLKRCDALDSTMQQAELYKGGSWASYKELYPIPNSEILLNGNLTQNKGY